MNQQRWIDLRGRLAGMLDNEVRLFDEDDLELFDTYVQDFDTERAARRVAGLLQAGPLDGDLLREVARRFEAVIGVPVPVRLRERYEAHDVFQWSTVPESSTMERPLSVPVANPAPP